MAAVDVGAAIRRSSHTFAGIVWPVLGPRLGGGEIIPVETVTEGRMAELLDTVAGIDMWHVKGQQMYGLASRVQYGPTPWDSFTIRFRRRSGIPTEWEKRIRAIADGALFPYLTVQAYVDGDRLLSAAAVPTRHLILRSLQYIGSQRRTNYSDGSEFIYVNWNQLDPNLITRIGEE